MFWYGGGMNAWGYWLMVFSSIVFWAAVVAAVVLLVRYFSRPGRQPGASPPPPSPPGAMPPGQPPPPHRAAPEDVLAERYARGEIGDEEYRQRLSTLRDVSGVPGGDGS